MNLIITIENLSKTFPHKNGRHRVPVLHEVNLEIHSGEFLLILGASGCGKSTFLRILAGLDEATHGNIRYAPSLSLNHISFVFQDFGLMPWLTVEENVELWLIGRDIPEHVRKEKVKSILERFGLTYFSKNRPKELSGGLKQRVGLARAFATDSQVIFLDEPFSELDFFTANNLRDELLSLWKEKKVTIVMVSHYVDEAVALADRIAVFSDRPGTIKEIVKNDLPRPRNSRENSFFGMEDKVLSYLRHE